MDLYTYQKIERGDDGIMSDDLAYKPTKLGVTRSGMQPNVVAALTYVFTVVTGPIILMIERENKYVRFHAIQAILYGVVWISLWIILGVIVNKMWLMPAVIWMIDAVLHFMLMLGGFIILLLLMSRAYKGDKYKLPILGNIADKIA